MVPERPPCDDPVGLGLISALAQINSSQLNSIAFGSACIRFAVERGARSGDVWIWSWGGVRVGNRCIAETMPVNKVAPQVGKSASKVPA
jgi:hypothetical protein